MTKQKKEQLKTAIDWCNKHDKSTEFMLTYCEDVTGLDLDEIIEYLEKEGNV